jgi:MFS transporter, DHA1 family, multidrug resistance protein
LPIIFIAPMSGRLSDRYGRYWPFLLGLFLIGVVFCIYSLPLTPWAIVFISILEGAVTSIARSSLDGLLADVMPSQMKGKVQANFGAAGLLGNLVGATVAGLLYGFTPGLPFLLQGLLCFAACPVLLLPGIAHMFRTARHRFSDELAEA